MRSVPHFPRSGRRRGTRRAVSVGIQAARLLILIGLQMGLSPLASRGASPPCVQFDVSDSAACRAIPDADFAAHNPDEMLLEARFRVSSLIRFGYEGDLFQYLYLITSPRQSIRIVDYFPKTEMATEVVGAVKVEQGKQQSAGMDLRSSGALEHPLGFSLQARAGYDANAHLQYEILPPMDLLAASGTMQRGAGAYFKLKPSPRTSLEGTKEFGLVLRVPRDWRGDYLLLHCAAYGQSGGTSRASSPQPICGSRAFVLPLYLDGDREAKEAAQRYLIEERRLREMAAHYAAEIRKRRYPTVGHRLGALVDLVEPKIPEGWLDQVWADPPNPEALGFRDYLPDDVNQAIDAFWGARRALGELRGGAAQPLAWQNLPLPADP